ncbi:MAG: hypothetical protein PHG82_00965 [Candidatus Gracilibacteria bacterium]|nr:hypothetical protein [Candidatus Gracilibacteria bacterium]
MSGDFIKNDKGLRTLYNGTIKYPDGKVDIYENGKKKNYMIQYMALMGAMVAVDLAGFTGVGTAPSLVIGTAYDGYNIKEFLSGNEDAGWQILKKSGLVDPRFNNGKQSYLEGALSVLGLVPGMTAATKGYKIAKFAKILKPEELAEFNKMESFFKDRFFGIGETAAKKGQIGLEHSKEANDLRKAREKAAKEKKSTKKTAETEVKTEKTSSEGAKTNEKSFSTKEGRGIISETKKLENARVNGKNGLPEGEFSKYAPRYENLYKELDAKGITDAAARGKEIKKLDREIAKDLLKSKIPETISDDIFDTFTKTGEIPKDVLESIAKKIAKNEKISDRELSIQQSFGKEIENILQKLAKSTKATEETIKTEARASEEILDNAGNISKFAKNKFTDLFKKELKENKSITIGENTYKKRADGKFEIEGDDILYSEKQILDKIKDEDKIVFLQSRAKQNIANLGEETIKLKDGFFDFLGKYKVSKNEVLVKENGTWRKITNETELNKFYSDNFEELLKKTKGIDVNKVAEDTSKSYFAKLSDTKFGKMGTAADNFMESIPYGPGGIYKFGKNKIAKPIFNDIITPYNIVKNFKASEGFGEATKAILFRDKNINWVLPNSINPITGFGSGIGKVGVYAIAPTRAEIMWDKYNGQAMEVNPANMATNYLEFMYLGVINSMILEYYEVDEKLGLGNSKKAA